MKTKFTLLALIISLLTFLSCSDDDNDNISVDPAIEQALKAKYPSASNIKWEQKGDYFVADFKLNQEEASAWISPNAIWQMTEIDITYEALPEAIKTAFKASKYSNWKIDDVDKIERINMETIYVIEVEQGKLEYDLYYSADGKLIKEISDSSNNSSENHLPGTMPEKVKQYINTNFPNAKILEVEKEKDGFEVDIMDVTIHRELQFNLAGEWVYTKTEVTVKDVPAIVMDALKKSQYASYEIDEIDHYKLKEKEYYYFELELNDVDVDITIDLTGKIELIK